MFSKELIAKLESAAEGSRELDAEIARQGGKERGVSALYDWGRHFPVCECIAGMAFALAIFFALFM